LTSLTDLALGDFLRGVGARTPSPGGGSVAAVTVSMAAGLVAMSALFSSKENESASEIAGSALDLQRRAERLADEDGEVYAAVLAAGRLQDADERSAALTHALGEAIRVPAEIAESAAAVAELGARLLAAINARLRGDCLTAIRLAVAAAVSSADLVAINVAEAGDAGSGDLEAAVRRSVDRAAAAAALAS
jgi:formiminotetrahydrofolate cyclodeaminase